MAMEIIALAMHSLLNNLRRQATISYAWILVDLATVMGNEHLLNPNKASQKIYSSFKT